MRQLTYVQPNLLEWWDVPEPRLQDDRDAIVAPLAVTRCDLDLSITTGRAGFAGPFAIGHEAAGVVTAVGDGVTPVCGTEFGGALSDFLRVPFADHMLVRQPPGHALSQTASLADAATAG